MSTVAELSKQAAGLADRVANRKTDLDRWLEVYSEELTNLTIKDIHKAKDGNVHRL